MVRRGSLLNLQLIMKKDNI